jgi:hypothetical protein
MQQLQFPIFQVRSWSFPARPVIFKAEKYFIFYINYAFINRYQTTIDNEAP